MKGFGEMFRLTSSEQRVVVIVVLALLAGAIIQKRHEEPERNLPHQVSPPTAHQTRRKQISFRLIPALDRNRQRAG